MKLSRPLAENIAKEMMRVIPYNINVMDENGVIVGSGDPARIGTLHIGAQKAIQTGRIYEVYEEGGGMKPGVNEPIVVKDEVIGVVGITGHPDEVRPLSNLLQVTVVLLIEQERQNKAMLNQRQNREKFYHELSYRKTPYDEPFLERAEGYGLDLTRKCRVLLVQGSVGGKVFRGLQQAYPQSWNLENDKTVFFMTDAMKYRSLLDKLTELDEVHSLGIGEREELAATSLEQAVSALELGMNIDPRRKVNFYEDLRFLISLAYNSDDTQASLYSLLEQGGDKLDLIETLQVYISENGDHNNTVKRLNIHRNTLHYRLNRIKQLTGKNPRHVLDLFELLCSLMWRK
ncbi:transcriptional regulator [Paenibacillus glucanolyticus]|jgi:carbohydrate diacid regulator|uniref:Transcriptional regulator n=1 Tax=Paenibacillus glucanolyticus TaxID=59843 RepID=A0A163IKT3_9BACL|nr:MULTISPECIES: sugar diacid recognition domain-containing protein [Paenibacillus]ANA79965.1 transcriptional regulator [Paenibacillus glucanolyticus]AVV56009.1 transcriptional regulator [Paenibacillus glucanolyticus]AWP30544.1 transcriptional regulator [Paenibacillus sp. Cedars]ETT38351.1 transcriptional regulator CdaR [Paenibacillus sp. FSL R5-808]KZS45995.1 transcriptional regulator [Paenibacillus glucanolyticus]